MLYSIFGVFLTYVKRLIVSPFERFDRLKSVIGKFHKMMTAFDHSDCPPEKWERHYFDFSEVESNQEFMKTNVDHVNMGILRQSSLISINDNLEIADGVKMVKERLITLAWRLHHE